MRKWIAFLTIMVAVSSCGTKLAETENAPSVPGTEIAVDKNGLVFDPSTQKIPFPNDIIWAQYGGNVTLPVDRASDNATKLLYRAINALHIKGFSPNMFIAVPLINNKSLTDVAGHYRLIDLTDFRICAASNGTSPACLDMEETSKLTFRQDEDFLKFYPVKHLDAGHQYVFTLEKGIRDGSGDILKPAIYKELESNSTLVDPQLEALREKYKPIYDSVLPNFGLTRDNVLEMFTFTTANRTLSLSDFGVIKRALTNSTIADNLESFITGLDYSSVPLEYEDIEASVMQSAAAPYIGFVNGGNNTILSFSIGSQSLEAVPYSIYNGANYTVYNNTIYVFLHGLGGDRKVAQLLTTDIPYAVISIDLPDHGDRVEVDNPYTSCFENVSGSCFLTENPGSDRLNFYQSIFDTRVLLRSLALGRFDIDGDGVLDTPKNIDFVGMSLGSIVGGSLLGIDSVTNNTVSRAVLNVGAANLVSVLDTATNEMITRMVKTLGVEKNSMDYFVTLSIFQTLLDPSDPAYLASSSIANKTIVQSAYGDSILPYVSNLSLAKISGFNSYTTVDFSNVAAAPGWYMFGNASAYVNHGFLLTTNISYYPEVSDYLAGQAVLQDAQRAAREQIKEFFGN
ncbi:hypothetical protein [Desulfurobacterium sp.]